ncbi:hypothetical protein GQ43DRAFT_335992, partial [Delitschia confertaspora ATCC 74209]
CCCCFNRYETYSVVIQHLESGACVSTMNRVDVNKSAATFLKWLAYIVKKRHEDILNNVGLRETHFYQVHPYECSMCGLEVQSLSALFMHMD